MFTSFSLFSWFCYATASAVMAFFGLLILLSGFHPIVRVWDSAVQSFPKLHIKNSRGFPFPFFSMAASAVCSPPLPLDRINLLIEIIIYQTWKIYKFIIFSYIYRVFLYFHEGYYNSFPESPQCNLCRCPSRFIPAKPFCRRAS